ncbi:MAG: YaiI/YqxD family protein [Methylococcaceae bacterium]|nr:YaiI/YqxD family protein [Methylococcaceae bacterium]
MPLHIWIDADACPNVIKDILFRTAERRQIPLILVANRIIATPPSAFIKAIQVAQGFDVADNHIVRHCQRNDLVITADIPLAAEIVAKQAYALNPRGELYTRETINEHLAMRDFMTELRNSGQTSSGGLSAFGPRDKQAFANALDRFLAMTR